MFGYIWYWFKRNHNNIIKLFRVFLFVFVLLILIVSIISRVYGVPEDKTIIWIENMTFSIFVISAVLLPMLLISYLSPGEQKTDEYIISGKSLLDLADEYERNLTPEEKLQEYTEHRTQWITSRIYSAIKQQEKKSIINLVLGISFSITGAVALLYLSHYFTFSPKDSLDFLSNFLPRLSLILLIETFAYFFLRLYKDNLKEIKYWHNELTAVEHRILALNLALKQNNETLVKDILLSFSIFEKNHKSIDGKNEFHLSSDYLVKIIKAMRR
ncbi:hypothetical protein [Pasteurella multocida]|uniref:hypothetical protein n=1 Tax=Pasteurella multocida TaxID=747 RepID=UPI0028777E06|nr:hypothetical protein [Pasteurella multocida]WND48701.1 hypothetical protein RHO06_02855 [Pasteurella multocida]